MRDVEVRELARKELKISKDSSNRFYKEELERIMKERGIIKQEFPPQSKEKLREMFAQSISDDFEKGYKIVDTMINGYKQQAREEMLKEIPCPQMSMESIFNCSCCWCKSLKETWLGEEVLKEK